MTIDIDPWHRESRTTPDKATESMWQTAVVQFHVFAKDKTGKQGFEFSFPRNTGSSEMDSMYAEAEERLKWEIGAIPSDAEDDVLETPYGANLRVVPFATDHEAEITLVTYIGEKPPPVKPTPPGLPVIQTIN